MGALPAIHPKNRKELVPFHKLSQWLCYSILDTFAMQGVHILDLEGLSALAECRNAGLLLDWGLIELRDQNLLGQEFPSHDPLIVEWRALSIACIQLLTSTLCSRLRLSVKELCVNQVLEGTWQLGRTLAKEKRPSTGNPPILIYNDGAIC